jgi:hypothetical protein
MTVSSLTNKISYTGNGSNKTFAFPFKVFDPTDLYVYVDGVLKTLDVDYTVPGIIWPLESGNVIFTDTYGPPPTGSSVLIYRWLPLTQLMDLVEGGQFAADTLEDSLDRLVMITQQLNEMSDRILMVPITAGEIDLELPIEGGKFFRWKSDESGLELIAIGDADALNVITTQGDLIRGGVGGVAERLGIGAEGKILGIVGGLPAWTDSTPGTPSIPAGSKVAFYQDTAPTGWTIINTLDDKLVYITKGHAAGGQYGGTVHITGSWTISGFDANVGNHTLNSAEIPAHSHSLGIYSAGVEDTGPIYILSSVMGQSPSGSPLTTASDGGSGGAHTHQMAAHNGSWRPAAYCFIICQKS